MPPAPNEENAIGTKYSSSIWLERFMSGWKYFFRGWPYVGFFANGARTWDTRNVGIRSRYVKWAAKIADVGVCWWRLGECGNGLGVDNKRIYVGIAIKAVRTRR